MEDWDSPRPIKLAKALADRLGENMKEPLREIIASIPIREARHPDFLHGQLNRIYTAVVPGIEVIQYPNNHEGVQGEMTLCLAENSLISRAVKVEINQSKLQAAIETVELKHPEIAPGVKGISPR